MRKYCPDFLQCSSLHKYATIYLKMPNLVFLVKKKKAGSSVISKKTKKIGHSAEIKHIISQNRFYRCKNTLQFRYDYQKNKNELDD